MLYEEEEVRALRAGIDESKPRHVEAIDEN